MRIRSKNHRKALSIKTQSAFCAHRGDAAESGGVAKPFTPASNECTTAKQKALDKVKSNAGGNVPLTFAVFLLLMAPRGANLWLSLQGGGVVD
jgi:hypothetical protein